MVRPEIAGLVAAIQFKEGQAVNAGDPRRPALRASPPGAKGPG
ncbi:MAG: hypothetical protein LM550_06745 [Candidatus Contendobacter sp.]|nr:biotin/lipoyl-binding protein [Gammaproteobacteria bacterium]MCC8993376.1 hypothetical protein [Candidatus Contendobacter sp.]